MENEEVRKQLYALAEEGYRKFSSALIPNIEADRILGVRLPALRQLARGIAKADWRSYLERAGDELFEEVMLQGMVIGYAKADIEVKLQAVERFVPKIDNWSVCDSFCVGWKIPPKHKDRVWGFLLPYLALPKEYDVRFAVVMLLNQYIDETYVERVLQQLNRVRHEAYYVRMAVAWALSVCFVKFPELTLEALKSGSWDDETYNRALQKIVESNRVDAETKQRIRGMKRKPLR